MGFVGSDSPSTKGYTYSAQKASVQQSVLDFSIVDFTSPYQDKENATAMYAKFFPGKCPIMSNGSPNNQEIADYFDFAKNAFDKTKALGLLPPPKNLRIKDNTGNTLTMSWDAIPDIEDYELYRYEDSINDFVIVNYTRNAGTNVLIDDGNGQLTPGKTYSYKLRYKDADGNVSEFSNTTSGALQVINVSQPVPSSEADDLIARVGQIVVLPSDETPTLATVTDSAKLAEEEPFFGNAQNGDKVLIYRNAKKAYLYRPSTNQLINVSNITF
jgi:hypothetical protein